MNYPWQPVCALFVGGCWHGKYEWIQSEWRNQMRVPHTTPRERRDRFRPFSGYNTPVDDSILFSHQIYRELPIVLANGKESRIVAMVHDSLSPEEGFRMFRRLGMRPWTSEYERGFRDGFRKGYQKARTDLQRPPGN